MQATDIRRYPSARLQALRLGATSQRVSAFMKANGRRPATDSSDPTEVNLAQELARAEDLALQTSRAKRNARQIVTHMFTTVGSGVGMPPALAAGRDRPRERHL